MLKPFIKIRRSKVRETHVDDKLRTFSAASETPPPSVELTIMKFS
jgi:hypothetical protein